MFCSFLLGDSIETILRVKRSSWVILAISGHFCKIEKARIFKNFAWWHPVKKYSRQKSNGNHSSSLQAVIEIEHNLCSTPNDPYLVIGGFNQERICVLFCRMNIKWSCRQNRHKVRKCIALLCLKIRFI